MKQMFEHNDAKDQPECTQENRANNITEPVHVEVYSVEAHNPDCSNVNASCCHLGSNRIPVCPSKVGEDAEENNAAGDVTAWERVAKLKQNLVQGSG